MNEVPRKIKAVRKLDGRIRLEIEGTDPLTLRPDQAFKLAAGIMKGLGIEVEYEWHGSEH